MTSSSPPVTQVKIMWPQSGHTPMGTFDPTGVTWLWPWVTAGLEEVILHFFCCWVYTTSKRNATLDIGTTLTLKGPVLFCLFCAQLPGGGGLLTQKVYTSPRMALRHPNKFLICLYLHITDHVHSSIHLQLTTRESCYEVRMEPPRQMMTILTPIL